MPKRFEGDYKDKKVVDTQTGEFIRFDKDNDGTLTMLASFLYNSMATMSERQVEKENTND